MWRPGPHHFKASNWPCSLWSCGLWGLVFQGLRHALDQLRALIDQTTVELHTVCAGVDFFNRVVTSHDATHTDQGKMHSQVHSQLAKGVATACCEWRAR